jgi:predicted kinase
MFESLEGLRGTGKSTVAPLLAAARGAVVVLAVPPSYQPLRREIDRRENAEARLCFYLSALFTATDEIQRHLSAGVPVVVERYFELSAGMCGRRAPASAVRAKQAGLPLGRPRGESHRPNDLRVRSIPGAACRHHEPHAGTGR